MQASSSMVRTLLHSPRFLPYFFSSLLFVGCVYKYFCRQIYRPKSYYVCIKMINDIGYFLVCSICCCCCSYICSFYYGCCCFALYYKYFPLSVSSMPAQHIQMCLRTYYKHIGVWRCTERGKQIWLLRVFFTKVTGTIAHLTNETQIIIQSNLCGAAVVKSTQNRSIFVLDFSRRGSVDFFSPKSLLWNSRSIPSVKVQFSHEFFRISSSWNTHRLVSQQIT